MTPTAGDGARDDTWSADEAARPGHAERDRDAAGRPRNARPRDDLGRPLPRGSGGGTPAEPRPLAPAAALAEAQSLLDQGLPFQAHEVLESAWKASPDPERDLWRGLTQVAVGLTHARRGNGRGAAALLRRGAQRLDSYGDSAPHQIDAPGLAQVARSLAEGIDAHGLGSTAARDLRPRLLRSS